jgi:lipid-binding SYLF domain-containing protein
MTRMRVLGTALLLVVIAGGLSAPVVLGASNAEVDGDPARALKKLYANNATARLLGPKAKAVLVFPNIVKAGFMFGGQMGNGALLQNGKPVAHYTPLRRHTVCRWGSRCSATPSSS